MRFNKYVAIVLCTAGSFSINAQKSELGKVTVAEITESVHPIDASAVAAVLFSIGETRFVYSQSKNFEMITTVKTRIKIYKKEGYEHATQRVRYYSYGSNTEIVSFSDAITYNVVDGKVVKTKLKSDGEFDERINRYWGERKITMPAIKEGSVIEFEYTIRSQRIGKIPDWAFQSAIPVNYSELKTYVPEYFVYNINQRGSIFPKTSTVKNSKTFDFAYRDENVPGESIIHSTRQERIEYIETVTTYAASGLPAMKPEAYVNNINNYTAGILHELTLVKYPNVPFKTFSTDWKTVTKTIYDNDDFGLELNKTGYFENDVDAVISGLKSQDELIAAIFNHVKSSVKWNNYYGVGCADGVRQAYKNKTGNVAEINLMLTGMLRYAGINANPILISTRSNGIAFFPTITAFNYVIAGVETQNGLILLDATEKFSSPNILPLRDLNWFGRLIRKDGTSSEVDLMPKTASREITFITMTVKNDGSAEGKIKRQLTDHEALAFRDKSVGISHGSYLESLENLLNGIEISNYTRENDFQPPKPISETYSFKSSKDIEIINGKIYISPLLFLASGENPFKQEKREYPIDFGYPRQDKYNINIEIPEGYVVESMPKAANVITGDDIGSFKYLIGNTGNKIQITISEDVNSAIIPADAYDVLKEFFQAMIDKKTEKIVLVKA